MPNELIQDKYICCLLRPNLRRIWPKMRPVDLTHTYISEFEWTPKSVLEVRIGVHFMVPGQSAVMTTGLIAHISYRSSLLMMKLVVLRAVLSYRNGNRQHCRTQHCWAHNIDSNEWIIVLCTVYSWVEFCVALSTQQPLLFQRTTSIHWHHSQLLRVVRRLSLVTDFRYSDRNNISFIFNPLQIKMVAALFLSCFTPFLTPCWHTILDLTSKRNL